VEEFRMAFVAGRFVSRVAVRNVGREFAKEMAFSMANEVMLDGKARTKPSWMSVLVTDPLARMGHEVISGHPPVHARYPTQGPSAQVAERRPDVVERRVPAHDFTRQELEQLHKPFPQLESQGIQKLMGHKVIDTHGAGELQRSKIQAEKLGRGNNLE
jgi:hypothetical protein